MKQFKYTSLAAAVLLGAGLMTVSVNAQAPCQDFATSGGWIVTDTGARANFGAGGGFLPGQAPDLFGYLTYVDHTASPVMLVSAQIVTDYCILACGPEGCLCRQITYYPATVRIGNDVTENCTVTVQVCDCGEPGVNDTFAICIPCVDYCQGGSLGADQPGGGNVQVHPPENGCTAEVPNCTELLPEACTCLLQCPL